MVYFEIGNRVVVFWHAETEIWMAIDGEQPQKLAEFPSNQPKAASYLDGIEDCLEVLKTRDLI